MAGRHPPCSGCGSGRAGRQRQALHYIGATAAQPAGKAARLQRMLIDDEAVLRACKCLASHGEWRNSGA